MNEMQIVRELLEAPPAPTRQVTEAALGRLEAGFGAGRESRPGVRVRRWMLGAGLVAAGAMAAATALLVPEGTDPPIDKAVVKPQPERELVLAAARQAERLAVGKYALTHKKDCHIVPVRAKTGHYVVQGCTEDFFWGAKKSKESDFWARTLPTLPQTDDDKELWRRAGSPATFDYPQDPKALPDHYKTTPGPWQRDGGYTGELLAFGTITNPTVERLQALPSDPKSLEKLLFPPPRDTADAKRMAMDPQGPGQRIVEVGQLLTAWIPPNVRAGMMRLLAETPGVRALGQVTDPIGRAGVGLEAERSSDTGTSTERIIFDPRTGEMLATVTICVVPDPDQKDVVKRGRVENSQVYLKSGWTSKKPVRPA